MARRLVAIRTILRTSLAVSVCLMLIKAVANLATSSVAILGDALESLVHVAAVAFSRLAAGWAEKPADKDHHYGHPKIVYLATGFGGA